MWWRKRREQDLERELRAHLELEAEEQGDASAARRALGNTTLIKEQVRETWGWNWLENLLRDVHYALRTLRPSPGFAVTAILTLALGIGASTAVFTMVDGVVLRPLSYRNSGELVALWERLPFLSFDAVGPNPRHADMWQKRASAFSGLALAGQGAGGVTLGADHPQLVGIVTASPNLLEVLQTNPLIGRGFVPQDGTKGHDQVAILTYGVWQSLFQGDPNVVGKIIRLADTPREVIGVLPPAFDFPDGNSLRAGRSRQLASSAPEPAVFVPAVIDPSQYGWNSDYGNWIALARLKPHIGIAQAQAQLSSIEAQIVQGVPAGERNEQLKAMRAEVQPLQEAVVGDSKTGLWLLMAAVMGLMLIACMNLANAQLGRALTRQRETALRTALGAGKWRLLWSSLAETAVLSAAGGAAGVGLAVVATQFFRRYSPLDLPRLSEVHVNVTVLLFSLGATLASSVLFGMLPALRFLRTDPQMALQQSSKRSAGSRQNRRLRTWLIGAQVFGCTVLLLLTGLFSKSLLFLLHQDRGFETGQVTIAEVNLPRTSYASDQSRVAFEEGVLENLRGIPGVESSGFVSTMPLEGESWIEGAGRVDRPGQEVLINLRWVSPGYFETTRQRLVGGRFLEESDRNPSGAVVSEGLAKSLWRDENPIGAKFVTEGRTFIVRGVVADSLSTSLKAPPVKTVYLHYKDRPPYTAVFMARGAQPAEAFASSMRQAIWKCAPGTTIRRIKTLDSQLSDSLAMERFQTFVLLSFGAAALLLAMLGIYGVLSYSTATRRQEIGVRMALGATRRQVYILIAGEAGAPVFAGLGAGLIVSAVAGDLVRKQLYGSQSVDLPLTLTVAGLFLAVCLVAALLPARRAASVDPLQALRSE